MLRPNLQPMPKTTIAAEIPEFDIQTDSTDWRDRMASCMTSVAFRSEPVKKYRGIGFQPVRLREKHDRLEAYPTFFHSRSVVRAYGGRLPVLW